MGFSFLVNKRPTLMICATRDMLKKISDDQHQCKVKTMIETYTEGSNTVDGKEIYLIVEPGQTWSELDVAIDAYTPKSVYLYLESSLDKMPLYKAALLEKIKNKFGPYVEVTTSLPK